MLKGEKIPIDIQSILDHGTGRWFNNFHNLISWSDFLNLEKQIKLVLNNHIKTYPNYKEIILINYKIFLEYTSLIYGLKLLDNFSDNIIFSKSNIYLSSLFENGIPETPIISFPSLHTNQRKKITNSLKNAKQNLIDNNFNLFKIFSPRKYIFKESRSHNAINFLKKKTSGLIFQLSFFDFLDDGKNYKISSKERQEIQDLVLHLIKDVCAVSKSFGVILNTIQKEYLINHTLDLFRKTTITVNMLSKKINGRRIDLHIGSNNNYYSRIMSVAIKRNNGRVIGFSHGEPVVYDWDLTSWLELSLNDLFYCYSNFLSKELIGVQKKRLLNKLFGNCLVRSTNKFNFNTLSTFEDRMKNSLKVETVMLIGNYYRNTSFSSITAVFPHLQLYIERSIIKELIDEGYKIIYKMHPSNFNNFGGIDNNLNKFQKLFPEQVEINVERFEDTINLADAFVFYYTSTSTLYNALISNKPIFYFDTKISQMTNNMSSNLEKFYKKRSTRLAKYLSKQ